MIYTNSKLDKEKALQDDLGKIKSEGIVWGNKNEKFDLGLENFGVDFDSLTLHSALKIHF